MTLQESLAKEYQAKAFTLQVQFEKRDGTELVCNSQRIVEETARFTFELGKSELLDFGNAVAGSFSLRLYRDEEIDRFFKKTNTYVAIQVKGAYAGEKDQTLYYATTIQPPTFDDTTVSLISYDDLTLLDEEYYHALDGNAIFTSGATLLDVAKNLLKKKLPSYSLVLPEVEPALNPMVKVPNEKILETTTYRELLQWALQALGLNVFVAGKTLVVRTTYPIAGELKEKDTFSQQLGETAYRYESVFLEGKEDKNYSVGAGELGLTLSGNPFLHEFGGWDTAKALLHSAQKAGSFTPFQVTTVPLYDASLLGQRLTITGATHDPVQGIITRLETTVLSRSTVECQGLNHVSSSNPRLGSGGERLRSQEIKTITNTDKLFNALEDQHETFKRTYETERAERIAEMKKAGLEMGDVKSKVDQVAKTAETAVTTANETQKNTEKILATTQSDLSQAKKDIEATKEETKKSVDSLMSSVSHAMESVDTKVGNLTNQVNGVRSEFQKSDKELLAKITSVENDGKTATGKFAEFKQNLDGIQTTVGVVTKSLDGKADKTDLKNKADKAELSKVSQKTDGIESSVASLSKTLDGKADKTAITRIEQTAIKITQTISETQSKVAGFRVNTRNLLLESDQKIVNTGTYRVARWELAEKLTAGETVTMTVCARPLKEGRWLRPFHGGGWIGFPALESRGETGDGYTLYSSTFPWADKRTDGDTTYTPQERYVWLYHGPNGEEGEIPPCYIKWAVLTRGTVPAVDWSKPPEETDKDIENTNTRIDTAEKSIQSLGTKTDGKITATNTRIDTANKTIQSLESSLNGKITQSNTRISTAESNISSIKNTLNSKADSSQITQLANRIETKVSSGDLISTINQQAGRVLITSWSGETKNILNITPETTYIKDATIKDAMIENLSGSKIKVDSALINQLTANTALIDKIKTTAINAMSGSFDSVYAKLAKLGGWTYTETEMMNRQDGYMLISNNPSRGYRIFAGPDSDHYNFAVAKDGRLFANGGTIGAFEINQGFLRSTSSQGALVLRADGQENYFIYAGPSIQSCNFLVRTDGSIWSRKGEIGGWRITATNIETSGNGYYVGLLSNAPNGFVIVAGQDAKHYDFYVTSQGRMFCRGGLVNGTHSGTTSSLSGGNYYNGSFSSGSFGGTHSGSFSGSHSGSANFSSGTYRGTHSGYSHMSNGSTLGGNELSGTGGGLKTGYLNSTGDIYLNGAVERYTYRALLTTSGWSTSNSDIRLKENVTPMGHRFDSLIYQLPLIRYTYKSDSNHCQQVGVNANFMVKNTPKDFYETFITKHPNNGYYGAQYQSLVPYLIQTIQDLNNRLRKLEGKEPMGLLDTRPGKGETAHE